MSVEWIAYNGKKILYSNFEGMKKETEIMQQLEHQMKTIAGSAEPVLLLVNIKTRR